MAPIGRVPFSAMPGGRAGEGGSSTCESSSYSAYRGAGSRQPSAWSTTPPSPPASTCSVWIRWVAGRCRRRQRPADPDGGDGPLERPNRHSGSSDRGPTRAGRLHHRRQRRQQPRCRPRRRDGDAAQPPHRLPAGRGDDGRRRLAAARRGVVQPGHQPVRRRTSGRAPHRPLPLPQPDPGPGRPRGDGDGSSMCVSTGWRRATGRPVSPRLRPIGAEPSCNGRPSWSIAPGGPWRERVPASSSSTAPPPGAESCRRHRHPGATPGCQTLS